MRTLPLHLCPNPSKYLLVYLTTLYTGACCCTLLTDLPWYLKCLLCTLCLVLYMQNLHRKQIIHLSVNASNEWQLLNEQGEITSVTLDTDSLSTPWLILLRFQAQLLPAEAGITSLLTHPPCYVVLPVDSLSKDDFRHLRLRLFFT